MAWDDSVTDFASFRGVTFWYRSVEGTFGRRVVLKEMPGRDKPRTEDNGRATRKFAIDMFLIGDNYPAERDQLRAALETPGPGLLRHPYLGLMNVTLEGEARFVETTREGGMCRITATFIEQGDELELQKPDPRAAVRSSTATLRQQVAARFEQIYSVSNAINSVVNDAIAAVQDVAGAFDTIRSKIASALQVVDDAKAAVDELVESAADLVQTPVTLASSVMDIATTVLAGITTLGDAFDAVAEFFGSEEALPSEGSILSDRSRVESLARAIPELRLIIDVLPELLDGDAQQQARKRENQRELERLVQAATIAAASETAIVLTYESYEQAQSMRDDLHTLIDDLLEDDELADEVYGPLVNLRAELVAHFESVASSLPELSEYTPTATTPALVLAYQLYGTVDKEAELLARNTHISDPSAVPGGQPLLVLLDA